MRLCFELAGIAGIDPRPLTLRQINWMADGRRIDEWNRTSLQCVLFANANRDPKKTRPFTLATFHPYIHETPPPRQTAGQILDRLAKRWKCQPAPNTAPQNSTR